MTVDMLWLKVQRHHNFWYGTRPYRTMPPCVARSRRGFPPAAEAFRSPRRPAEASRPYLFAPPAAMEPSAVAFFLRTDQRYQKAEDDLVNGSGGFGVAYVAVDLLTQTTVVVKRQVLHGARAGRELAAFHVLKAFTHPNVLEMLDSFESNNCLHLVFEAAAMDLWEVWATPVGRDRLLQASSLQRYLEGAFAGVAHLHACDVAHGDLSLRNCLAMDDHTVKVCDLGTAHTPQSLLQTNDSISTSYVRAPELLGGGTLVVRTSLPTCGR